MDAKVQVAVVGGSGVVGKELLSALLDREFPADQLTILASDRSEGSEVEYGDDSLAIEKATADSFRGMHVVLLATPPEVSQKLAPAAQAAGAWVVDCSAAFRGNRDVPLALPLLRKDGIAPQKGRIVRVPSALTTALVLALEPLRQRFGVVQIEGTALIAASASGERGIGELEKQTTALLSGRDPDPSFFPYRLGFNLIPQVGGMTERGWSEEELWTVDDARVLWGEGGRTIPLALTAIQVPTFYGHALSLSVRLRSAVSADAVRDSLRGVEEVKLIDDPAQKIYPLPMTVTADTAVHVGRIRVLPESPEWVRLYVVIDNAGRGAALNAIETAEVLLGSPLGDPDAASASDEDEDRDEDDSDETDAGADAGDEDDASAEESGAGTPAGSEASDALGSDDGDEPYFDEDEDEDESEEAGPADETPDDEDRGGSNS